MRLPILSLIAATTFVVAPLSIPAHAQSTGTRTLTVAAPWEVAALDPATQGYVLQRMQIAETLVDADAQGKLRPGLATAWSASEDDNTWTFTLREGVEFHDGTALNAQAVAAALNHAFKKPGALAKLPITAIRADGSDVIVEMSEAFAALPAFLANYSAVILAPASYDDAGQATRAIGTGPYEVDAFEPPLQLTVKRFDGYWGENASVEKVSYNATSRAETRALLAESGQGDLVFTLDPSGVARLGDIEDIKVTSVAIPRVVTLKVNVGNPALADVKTRRAISLAIDRAGIAAGILRAPEAAANQVFAPILSAWHDDAMPPAIRDVEQAKALLAGLGWTPGDDGILRRDDEPFRVTLRTFPDRPELPLIAAAIQAQLKEVGIDVAVSIGNSSDIPAGHQDGSLDMALLARNFGLTPDPIGTALADYADGGGDWGAMNWRRPDVTAALKTIAATANEAERAGPIRLVRDALANDLPIIPIAWYQHTVAQSGRIEGVTVDPLERSYNLSTIRWRE